MINHWIRKNQAFPLQVVLVLPFVLQVFGAVSLVGYLSFRNGQRAVDDLAEQVIDRTSNVVDERLNSYLSVPQTLGQLNAAAIRRGTLDVSDPAALNQYFWDQMQAYDLTYIGVGLTTGEGMGVARYDGQTITMDEWTSVLPNNISTYATDADGNRMELLDRWDFDSLNEDWYTETLETEQPIWRIYEANFPSGPYITATASRPLYDSQNRLIGMIGTDIHLQKLSDFLRNLDVSQSGKVFIMERDGTMIATSTNTPFFTVENDDVQRLSALAISDPTIQAIAKHLQTSNVFQTIREDTNWLVEVEGEKTFIDVTPWQDDYGLDWLMVTSVPESAFMAQINRNTRITIALCLGALAISSILGVLTSRLIARPIWRLNRASQAMAAGNLDQTVENSGIQELDVLSSSFNHMAQKLRKSFAALEENKAKLEERVEVRTAELKNTLAELQRTQSQVIQSEKMSSLGQLVAGVAHEINNPVNFIHGNLSHIEDYTEELLGFLRLYQEYEPNPAPEIQAAADEIDLEFLQEDLAKILSSMKLGTDRIRQIVLSLRNFSRMDEAEFKAVDIHAGLDSTLMILQHRFKARPERPEIEIIKEYGTLPLVECYAGQLNQVFMNILGNAIDAIDEENAKHNYQELQAHPSRLTIRTAMVGKAWIEVAIADNGVGIPPAIQDKIFNPFFTTKPLGKGTGMGMSISYQIITEKHNGTLKCVSVPGEGTEFIIRIPLHQITQSDANLLRGGENSGQSQHENITTSISEPSGRVSDRRID